MNVIKGIGIFLLDFVETIAISLSIFVLVYVFLVQPYQVKGSSMLPNFENGENLLANKIGYRFNDPRRGEVVVFKAPQNLSYDYIKRIIGLPGETVLIKNSQISINNQLLDESSYLPDDFITRGGRFLGENQSYVLKNNEYFVLGDNRDHSSDSRDWGIVPQQDIIGKAWFVYWPLNHMRLIKREVYAGLLSALKVLPTTPW